MKNISIVELDQAPSRFVHGYYYQWFKYQEYLFKHPEIAETKAKSKAMIDAFLGMG